MVNESGDFTIISMLVDNGNYSNMRNTIYGSRETWFTEVEEHGLTIRAADGNTWVDRRQLVDVNTSGGGIVSSSFSTSSCLVDKGVDEKGRLAGGKALHRGCGSSGDIIEWLVRLWRNLESGFSPKSNSDIVRSVRLMTASATKPVYLIFGKSALCIMGAFNVLHCPFIMWYGIQYSWIW